MYSIFSVALSFFTSSTFGMLKNLSKIFYIVYVKIIINYIKLNNINFCQLNLELMVSCVEEIVKVWCCPIWIRISTISFS